MKPLFLKIAGLNSFRAEQVIDFQELTSSGLFGIFGPTGSGKSTVLDAITLALYGKVERAKNSIRGIVNQNENNAFVSFTFNLGKRKFTVERNYKKNAEGAVNHQSSRLLEETGNQLVVLAEGKTNVDNEIVNILGLNAADFTRAVVLPQGQFAEFLNLKSSDRGEMLQRLFGLEKYGDNLVRKIRNELSKANNDLDNLLGRQNELGDASVKALAIARNALKEKKLDLAALQLTNQRIKEEFTEYQEIIRLQNELKAIQLEEDNLNCKEAEILVLQKKYKLATKAIILQPFLERAENESKLFDLLTKEKNVAWQTLNNQKDNYEQASRNNSYWQNKSETEGKELDNLLLKIDDAILAEQEYSQKQTELQNLNKEYSLKQQTTQSLEIVLGELKMKKESLQKTKIQLQKDLGFVKEQLLAKEIIVQIREAWQVFQSANNNLLGMQADYRDRFEQTELLLEQKKNASGKLAKLKLELALLEKEIIDLEKEKISYEEIEMKKNEIDNLGKLINNLQFNYQDLYQKQEGIGQNNNKIISLETGLNKYEGLSVTLVFNKASLEKEIASLERAYSNSEKANLAYFLGKDLDENTACPVCGSLEHPQLIQKAAQEEDLQKISKQIEKKKEEAQKLERDIDNIRQQQIRLEAQRDALQELNKKLRAEEEAVFQKINLIRKEIKEDWSQINLQDLEAIYQSEKSLLLKMQQDWQNILASQEILKSKKSKLENEQIKTKEEYIALEAREGVFLEEQKSLEEKLLIIQNETAVKEKVFLKIAGGLTGVLIEDKYQHLLQMEKSKEDLIEKEQKTNAEFEKINDQLFKNHHEFQSLNTELDIFKNNEIYLQADLERLGAQIRQITGGKKAEIVKKELVFRQAELQERLKTAQAKLEMARKAYEEQNSNCLTIETRLNDTEKRLQESKNNLQIRLSEQGFLSRENLKKALISEEEIKALKNRIEDFTQEKLMVGQNLARIAASLKGRSLTEKKWREFLTQKEETEQKLADEQKLFHQLEDRYATLKQNHLRWNELEEQRKTIAELAGKLVELNRLFKANAFIEFITEEQLINVALEASERLGELTGYKYALAIDADGSFIIRDNHNGGLSRPATSLSGGETFLTSLALALALSGQIQLRGEYPLEFFFLDEGFGTLDNTLLDTVINSLEKLHSEKMSIGLISHVPELQARIAKKILVSGAEIGGSGSTLEFESS